MESDDFTRHYIIRYLSARELVLPPLIPKNNPSENGVHTRCSGVTIQLTWRLESTTEGSALYPRTTLVKMATKSSLTAL